MDWMLRVCLDELYPFRVHGCQEQCLKTIGLIFFFFNSHCLRDLWELLPSLIYSPVYLPPRQRAWHKCWTHFAWMSEWMTQSINGFELLLKESWLVCISQASSHSSLSGLWKQGPSRETLPSSSGAVATDVHVFYYLLTVLTMPRPLAISFSILFSQDGGTMAF